MSNNCLNKIAISLFAGAAMALVAGCELAPVFLEGQSNSTGIGTVSALSQKLATISLDAPKTRPEQVIIADLSFSLHGNTPTQVKLFTLNVSVKSTNAKASPVATTGSEIPYSTTLTASFTLTENGTETVMLNDLRTSTAQYSRSDQITANNKALEKAQEQAAHDLSKMIQARLTAYFSNGK